MIRNRSARPTYTLLFFGVKSHATKAILCRELAGHVALVKEWHTTERQDIRRNDKIMNQILDVTAGGILIAQAFK